jgi:hypothetical protein
MFVDIVKTKITTTVPKAKDHFSHSRQMTMGTGVQSDVDPAKKIEPFLFWNRPDDRPGPDKLWGLLTVIKRDHRWRDMQVP